MYTNNHQETLYFANGSIGTPPQAQRWHLDTGSSDLWVNTPSSSLCTDSLISCRYAGLYNANASSTYEFISSNFNISYEDGSSAGGDYVSDVLTIGSTKISRLQFGIGYFSSSYEGVLGIGYPTNEVQVVRAGKSPYENLPVKMVSDGLSSSHAYSIWLNDLDASTGSILFGGVDPSRYEGTLQTLPIQTRIPGTYSEFFITLTGLSYANQLISSTLAHAVLLDTGSSLSYLPNTLADNIFTAAGATYMPEADAAYIPCAMRKDTTSLLTFTFSTVNITVDMSELVIPVAAGPNGEPLAFADGTEACIFGISRADGGSSVLGDTFLRSAYVVYDLGRNEISLAQTRFNATGSSGEILEIVATGDDGVPGAKTVANPVSATAGLRGGNGRLTATTAADGAKSTSGGGNLAMFGRWKVTLCAAVVGIAAMSLF